MPLLDFCYSVLIRREPSGGVEVLSQGALIVSIGIKTNPETKSDSLALHF